MRLPHHENLLGALADARALGFLGPGPVEDHLDHSMRYAVALGDRLVGPAVDLGSGGGVPGLVLALAFPQVSWVFVDASKRRTSFLADVVERLGLADRVTVLTGRAEEIGRNISHRGSYQTVVVRSFGAPGVVAECAAPLLRPGGYLAVSEPPPRLGEPAVVSSEAVSASGSRWPDDGLHAVGLEAAPSNDPGIFVATLLTPTGDRYPRRTGIPTKRPLF